MLFSHFKKGKTTAIFEIFIFTFLPIRRGKYIPYICIYHIYIYISHIYIYIYIYLYIHTYTCWLLAAGCWLLNFIYLYMYTYTHTYKCIHTYIHIYVYVYIYMYCITYNIYTVLYAVYIRIRTYTVILQQSPARGGANKLEYAGQAQNRCDSFINAVLRKLFSMLPRRMQAP